VCDSGADSCPDRTASKLHCENTGLKETLYVRTFWDRNVTFIVLSCEVKLVSFAFESSHSSRQITKCSSIFYMVQILYRITGFSEFVHRPDSNYLGEKEKHDVSETGSVSVVK
jgi:hypothetical protein